MRQTLLEMSADSRDALHDLAQTEVSPEAFEAALGRFGGEDVSRLRGYVRARARLARRGPRHALAKIRMASGSVWREVTRVLG